MKKIFSLVFILACLQSFGQGIPITNGFTLNTPRYSDLRTGKIVSGKSVPYASVAEANSIIPSAFRPTCLEVIINTGGVPKKYWYFPNSADSSLRPEPVDYNDMINAPQIPTISGSAVSGSFPNYVINSTGGNDTASGTLDNRADSGSLRYITEPNYKTPYDLPSLNKVRALQSPDGISTLSNSEKLYRSLLYLGIDNVVLNSNSVGAGGEASNVKNGWFSLLSKHFQNYQDGLNNYETGISCGFGSPGLIGWTYDETNGTHGDVNGGPINFRTYFNPGLVMNTVTPIKLKYLDIWFSMSPNDGDVDFYMDGTMYRSVHVYNNTNMSTFDSTATPDPNNPHNYSIHFRTGITAGVFLIQLINHDQTRGKHVTSFQQNSISGSIAAAYSYHPDLLHSMVGNGKRTNRNIHYFAFTLNDINTNTPTEYYNYQYAAMRQLKDSGDMPIIISYPMYSGLVNAQPYDISLYYSVNKKLAKDLGIKHIDLNVIDFNAKGWMSAPNGVHENDMGHLVMDSMIEKETADYLETVITTATTTTGGGGSTSGLQAVTDVSPTTTAVLDAGGFQSTSFSGADTGYAFISPAGKIFKNLGNNKLKDNAGFTDPYSVVAPGYYAATTGNPSNAPTVNNYGSMYVFGTLTSNNINFANYLWMDVNGLMFTHNKQYGTHAGGWNKVMQSDLNQDFHVSTQSPGDNSDKVANTAFVAAAVSASSGAGVTSLSDFNYVGSNNFGSFATPSNTTTNQPTAGQYGGFQRIPTVYGNSNFFLNLEADYNGNAWFRNYNFGVFAARRKIATFEPDNTFVTPSNLQVQGVVDVQRIDIRGNLYFIDGTGGAWAAFASRRVVGPSVFIDLTNAGLWNGDTVLTYLTRVRGDLSTNDNIHIPTTKAVVDAIAGIATPTISSPTVSVGSLVTGSATVTGNDREGYVTLTVTGSSSLATNSELFTLTLGGSYSSIQPPLFSIFSTSSTSPGAALQLWGKNVSATGFSIATAPSVTLAAGTYMIKYTTPAK